MSESANIAVVRKVYESKAAPEVLQEVMDPELGWDITPGFRWRCVPRLGERGQGLRPAHGEVRPPLPMGEEYFADAEGHVFALGHYHTVTRNGKSADVRFVHIWTARDGKLVKLQQTGDSLVLHQALDG